MPENDWAVFRQDFSGNEFLVERDLTHERALELVDTYESHKHHQHYWADRIRELGPDYLKMYQKLINDGSSPTLAIQVLMNQGASMETCVAIHARTHEAELSDSAKFVRTLVSD
jgi:hypothetical protein